MEHPVHRRGGKGVARPDGFGVSRPFQRLDHRPGGVVGAAHSDHHKGVRLLPDFPGNRFQTGQSVLSRPFFNVHPAGAHQVEPHLLLHPGQQRRVFLRLRPQFLVGEPSGLVRKGQFQHVFPSFYCPQGCPYSSIGSSARSFIQRWTEAVLKVPGRARMFGCGPTNFFIASESASSKVARVFNPIPLA